MTVAQEWVEMPKLPPLHVGVLVQLTYAPGFVCDVACYVGKYQRPEGGAEERWILADVRLESHQIKRWALLNDPEDEEEYSVE
jgi:hypothetical protein